MEVDVRCPQCGQVFMRVHSLLKETAQGTTDVRYEWECMWCGHREGDYFNFDEAKKDYEKIKEKQKI